jgi:hypothetical protein
MVQGAHQSGASCYPGRFSEWQTVLHLSKEKINFQKISSLQGARRHEGYRVSYALNWFASC